MPHWSARRGLVEPLVALAAVFVLGMALMVYGGVVGGLALPSEPDRSAAIEWARVEHALRTGGIITPRRFANIPPAPSGISRRITITAGKHRWSRGPEGPPRADVHSRQIPVRVAPGTVRPGRLRVEVWRA